MNTSLPANFMGQLGLQHADGGRVERGRKGHVGLRHP